MTHPFLLGVHDELEWFIDGQSDVVESPLLCQVTEQGSERHGAGLGEAGVEQDVLEVFHQGSGETFDIKRLLWLQTFNLERNCAMSVHVHEPCTGIVRKSGVLSIERMTWILNHIYCNCIPLLIALYDFQEVHDLIDTESRFNWIV